eukprot:12600487-Alexandrium_andersonii.AAC.1
MACAGCGSQLRGRVPARLGFALWWLCRRLSRVLDVLGQVSFRSSFLHAEFVPDVVQLMLRHYLRIARITWGAAQCM